MQILTYGRKYLNSEGSSLGKTSKSSIRPTIDITKELFNYQLLNTLITLKQETGWLTFIIGGAILINNSTNFEKKKKHNFNSQLIRLVSTWYANPPPPPPPPPPKKKNYYFKQFSATTLLQCNFMQKN